ncbi:MAG: hypothetical protein AAF806_27530 [Bacteroidota bacterium]
MRKTATLFTFILCTIIGFSQNHVRPISNPSNEWLEENEKANKAIQFTVDVLSDAIELFWEVSREQALAGYELQRAINSSNFEKVAWFTAVGEDEIGGTYLHLDENPYYKDVILYRIKAVRKDGQYLYSSTQIVTCK